MTERRHDLRLTHILKLVCVPVLIVCILLLPGAGLALQAPPPPPPDTPTFTPVPPTPTFTPEAPTPTFTPEPPTPTFTPEAPTPTFTPQAPTPTYTSQPPTGPSTTPQPTNTRRPEEPGEPSAPSPLCRSMVEGYVLGSGGQRVTGATVTIEGSGWSSGIMTDDNGRYGFAGLCAGTATLRAFLSSGQAGPVATVSFSGSNSLRQDLNFTTSSPVPASATQASQGTAQPAPTGTAEAGMPVTGYAGWLLAGGAVLGALLLVSAGGRRALQAYERARSRE